MALLPALLPVAEVYSPAEEVEGDPPTDDMKAECRFTTPEEDVGSHPLEHLGVEKWVCPRDGPAECRFIAPEEDVGSHPLEHSGVEKWVYPRDGPARSASCWKLTGRELLEHSPCRGSKQSITDVQEQPEEGEAIVVGAVGSAAPCFLTGWTNDIEVEFMIGTGCQLTILATSVFERMCAADPQVRSRIRPCARRLVSADSSLLTVIGELELDVVFPGLKCVMCCVVASIGSHGLLGTEALQSCLPHQQKPTPEINGLVLTSVVLPPDSEVVAPIALTSGQLGTCALIIPSRQLTEDFGVVVGHTLVDASTCSANVLMINPKAEEVVLPCKTSVGKLVPISTVLVALSELQLPADEVVSLPEHLEDIVKGSHPSLGETSRRLLRELLHRYEHVFPAPGEPVTGCTKSTQHEIITKDARPIRCGPRRLAPTGLRTEQECAKDMLIGGQIACGLPQWC